MWKAARGERHVTIEGQWCQQHYVLRSNKDQEIREHHEYKSGTFLGVESNHDNKTESTAADLPYRVF